MYPRSVTSVVLGVLPFLPTAVLGSPTVTDPSTGVSYQGTSSNGVEQFQNVFFAQDTGGKNRFQPPQPLELAKGTVVDATKPGAACIQALGQSFPFIDPVNNTSEDCLSLRILRPAGIDANAKLPVLHWLYGGASVIGNIYDSYYDPVGLVEQSIANGQPVIVVASNYRVGILGNAASEYLYDDKRGNIMLRDQRAGFQWTRDHIAAFGGDCGKVTAFGHSAGATSIAYHITGFGGEQPPPFDQAIMLSGTTQTNFGGNTDAGIAVTTAVADLVGCGGGVVTKETISCMQKVPADKMLAAQTNASAVAPFAITITVDGDFVPERPSLLLQSGRFAKGIPMITTWAHNDGSLFVPATTNNDSAIGKALQSTWSNLTQPSVDRLLDLYPLNEFQSDVSVAKGAPSAYFYRASRMFRDLAFTCGAFYFGLNVFRQSTPSVRLYELNQTVLGPIAADKFHEPYLGVCHLSDIPYLFNRVAALTGDNNTADNRAIGQQYAGSVAAFAATGDPSHKVKHDASVFEDWSLAFDGLEYFDPVADMALQFDLLEIGGPDGTASTSLDIFDGIVSGIWGVLAGIFGHGGGSNNGQANFTKKDLQKAVEQEKLFERCAFINTIYDELEGFAPVAHVAKRDL